MKYKTTAKAIRAGYSEIIQAGYCGAYWLLYGLRPVAYTAGVYGWNFDVYETEAGAVVCTGYRGMPGKRLPYDFIKGYETRAEAAAYSAGDYDKRLEAIAAIRAEFITAARDVKGVK